MPESEIVIIASMLIILVAWRHFRRKKPGFLVDNRPEISTSERAFKVSVCPLAALCLLYSLGVIFIVASWSGDEFAKLTVPFIPDALKVHFLLAVAVANVVIGVGLLLRFRPAWLLFLAFLVISPIYLIMGIAFDYFPGLPSKIVLIPVVAVLSVGLWVGLYSVTKPAFKGTFRPKP